MASLLDTFRVLSQFEPAGASLSDAPWDAYVDWAVSQGLGPLAAYNLEYRLGGGGAPEWARDRLLSIYQGSLNDNVMKLVNFKRAIDELEGCRLVLLGSASFAEALYPHVAFRPVLELEALARAEDLDALAACLLKSEFKTVPAEPGEGADRVLFDGRTRVLVNTGILGPARKAEETRMLSLATPMKVYGPSVFRLDLEDAVLVEALGHARSDYVLPAICWVDFRELLRGAPSMGGAYSRPLDTELLRQRAHAWKLERALWASLSIAESLFPETRDIVSRAKPPLRLPTRELLERTVVRPAAALDIAAAPVSGRVDRLRRLLVGT